MNYEERMVKLCKECPEREQCGYVPRKLMGDCIYLQDVMSGWELGQQDTLEEIENAINEFDEDDPIFSHYIAVVDKIQELKR